MLKIAIFDLTDCEGCELQFLNLREELLDLAEKVEIVNWRLGQEKEKETYDIAFVEGTPLTKSEVTKLKRIRQQAKILIALGACAHLGGVNALASPKERDKFQKEIYKKKKATTPVKPLDFYVKVDTTLPGCPIDRDELERFLNDIITEVLPKPRAEPVCFTCRAAQISCLLLEGKPCLGPATQGGCGAVCPKNGLPCTGCFGILEGQEVKNLKKLLEEKVGREKTREQFEIFLKDTQEYKKLYES